MADEKNGTLYAKGMPEAVQEELNRCSKQEVGPDGRPMTLAQYIAHVHGFYQARKNTTLAGPTIEADGTTPGAAPGGHDLALDDASAMNAKAALYAALAAVAGVKGNGVLARTVRNFVVSELAPYAPPPAARRVPPSRSDPQLQLVES